MTIPTTSSSRNGRFQLQVRGLLLLGSFFMLLVVVALETVTASAVIASIMSGVSASKNRYISCRQLQKLSCEGATRNATSNYSDGVGCTIIMIRHGCQHCRG